MQACTCTARPVVQLFERRDGLLFPLHRAPRCTTPLHAPPPSSPQVSARNAKKESPLSLALASGSDELLAAVLAVGPDLGQDGPQMLRAAIEQKRDAVAAKVGMHVPPLVYQSACLGLLLVGLGPWWEPFCWQGDLASGTWDIVTLETSP